ncbi:MAG: hypothetical protein DRP88_04160 [Candidatus Neomarinimicrobiota bacterium]|nr:MAG: hypothetical protein DRP88_04160 [Candidatus Neomarinimicrobiota bacterium]
MNKNKIALIALLSFVVLTLKLKGNETYYLLKAGIHFDSKVSGGKYTLEELARIISKEKLDVAIITDHDNMEVSYGIKPFENLLKITVKRNSVATYGFENYFAEINYLDRIYKDIILIPGIEAVPFYFWEGSPVYENLELRNWHTHLLVFGMDSYKDYEKLPSLARGIGYKKPNGNTFRYISQNMAYFFKIFLYFLALLFFFTRIIRRRRSPGTRKKYRFSIFSLLMTVLIILLLKSEYPFLPRLYDQYHGDPGAGPFQALIDYVHNHNGLIFWAHPEVTHEENLPLNIPLMQNSIRVFTKAYPHLIAETKQHNGFAIFWEGMKVLGKPGGLWDLTLKEYCLNYRKIPVWTIGELDFEESNNLDLIHETNTFIFVKEKSRDGVIEAMRNGRMYSTRDYFGDKIRLIDFSVHDPMSGNSAFIGETLKLTYPQINIHIKLECLENFKGSQNIYVFLGEKLVQKIPFYRSTDIWLEDSNFPKDKMFYYKIYIGKDDWIVLVTNPIFVKKLF